MNADFSGCTVGDIVAGDWRAAAVFEQFGIDFCCGGGRLVGDACRAAHADPTAVEHALDRLHETDAAEPASHWSVDRLVNHIVHEHHAYVRNAVPRIADYLTKLVAVHGANHPELTRVATTFDALGHNLLQHLRKEEQVLFPYIRQLALAPGTIASPFGSVENPVRMMEREHERAGELLRGIRALTGNYIAPNDACTTYRVCLFELAAFERDLHRHVHLENNVLFPRAIALEEAGA